MFHNYSALYKFTIDIDVDIDIDVAGNVIQITRKI